MSNLYFWVSFAHDFYQRLYFWVQRLYFWVQLSEARTRLPTDLVSTDSSGDSEKNNAQMTPSEEKL